MSERTESRLSRLKSGDAVPPEIAVAFSIISFVVGRVSDFDTIRKHMSQILEIWHFILSPLGNLLTFALGVGWLGFILMKEPKQPSLTTTVASPSAPNSELQYRPLAGIELLKFMESAKLASAADAFFTPTPVKIVCSDKGRDVADQLARALILLDFEVVVNHDNASHLFRARPDQPVGITLRSQPGNRVMMMVGTGLSGAHLNCTKVEFPKDEKYNYTQIEIGDPTTDSYWDRSGP
jgi:hypothetical protein